MLVEIILTFCGRPSLGMFEIPMEDETTAKHVFEKKLAVAWHFHNIVVREN
jgi:hypothetical protein